MDYSDALKLISQPIRATELPHSLEKPFRRLQHFRLFLSFGCSLYSAWKRGEWMQPEIERWCDGYLR